jgi:hypothetical protein
MRISVILSAALSAVTLVGSTAMAAPDKKTYPGVEAQANNASILYSNGRALNNGAAASTYFLPVIRDEETNVGITAARIWVIDQAPQAGADVSCQIVTRFSATGGTHDFETQKTSGSDPTPEALLFASLHAPPAPTILGADGDYYHINCVVPGTAAPAQGLSGILSYEVFEGL